MITQEEREYLQEFTSSPGFKGLQKLVNDQVLLYKERLCSCSLSLDERTILLDRCILEGAKKIQNFIDELPKALRK